MNSGNTTNNVIKIEAFIPVFDDKLKRHKKKLKALLEKPKKDRDKKAIKALIKEAKGLRDTIKLAKKIRKVCPHCGHDLGDL